MAAGDKAAIVAPFEADSQLALMSRRRQVSHVLTTDSDLVVHGCSSVLLAPMGNPDDSLDFGTVCGKTTRR